MKNFLSIDLYTDRKNPGHILIGKSPERPLEGWPSHEVLADFATLLSEM